MVLRQCTNSTIFHAYGLLRLTKCNIFHNACTMYHGLNSRLCNLVPVCRPLHSHDTWKSIDTLVWVSCAEDPRFGMSLMKIPKCQQPVSFKENLKNYLLSKYRDFVIHVCYSRTTNMKLNIQILGFWCHPCYCSKLIRSNVIWFYLSTLC